MLRLTKSSSTHIEINRESHPPSVVDEEEELRDTGVHVSPHISPQYSEKGGESSHEGSSEFRGEEFVHLRYPHESQDPDVHSSDSASRLGHQTSPPDHLSRSTSSRRGDPVDPGLHRSRELGSDDDSTVEFIRHPDGRLMPRDRLYYGNHGGYTHSSSSGAGSYYPQGQMVPFPHHQPMPVAYPQQYPQIASPSTIYAPTHPGFAPYQAHPSSHMASPYSPPPYGMMPYGPPGYFPPQYPQQYPLPPHMDAWRVPSSPPPPSQSPPASASTALVSEPEKSKVDPDEIAKKIEAIMLAHTERESQERLAREEMRISAEKAAADAAAAKAEREAAEKRIREEAAAAATKAAEDARKAETERAAREKQIREEAAAEALKKAAKEAEAQAAKAAADKKIAEEAATAAKTEAEKKAAEEADKPKEESDKKQKEAEEKQKEAEDVATKAKKEAEEAKKAAEAAAPTEKKAPIRFHDAVGRKFNFPFEICSRWRGMEVLINQAFQHVEKIGEHVQQGHYDLVGPGGEVILKSVRDAVIEPDWHITMHMWPMPEDEKKDDEDGAIVVPPDFLDGALNMDDILGTGKKDKSKGALVYSPTNIEAPVR